jgi:hypothetical protein
MAASGGEGMSGTIRVGHKEPGSRRWEFARLPGSYTPDEAQRLVEDITKRGLWAMTETDERDETLSVYYPPQLTSASP